MMKLIDTTIAQNKIEAHSGKATHQDKGQDIDVKAGKDKRESQQKNKDDRH
jgi:hypothetical protein